MVKYKQLIEKLKADNDRQTLLYFFEQTGKELEEILSAAALTNHLVANAHNYKIENAESLILVEIHPLASVTDKLVAILKPETTIICYIGMDEFLMKLFNSNRIISLMEKMGMNPDEVISHSMVTKSIQKAQNKLDQKLPHPKVVLDSVEKWAAVNGVTQMAL